MNSLQYTLNKGSSDGGSSHDTQRTTHAEVPKIDLDELNPQQITFQNPVTPIIVVEESISPVKIPEPKKVPLNLNITALDKGFGVLKKQKSLRP